MCSKLVLQSRFFSAFFLLDSESSPTLFVPDLVGYGLLHYGSF